MPVKVALSVHDNQVLWLLGMIFLNLVNLVHILPDLVKILAFEFLIFLKYGTLPNIS